MVVARTILESVGVDELSMARLNIARSRIRFNRPPEVDHAAVDFQIDLVQMPSRVRFRATL